MNPTMEIVKPLSLERQEIPCPVCKGKGIKTINNSDGIGYSSTQSFIATCPFCKGKKEVLEPIEDYIARLIRMIKWLAKHYILGEDDEYIVSRINARISAAEKAVKENKAENAAKEVVKENEASHDWQQSMECVFNKRRRDETPCKECDKNHSGFKHRKEEEK